MKTLTLLKTLFICFDLIVFSLYTSAQVITLTGPSDATSNAPANASAVSQILSVGATISLKIGSSSTATDIIYQWYKFDHTGVKQLIQQSNDNTMHETASAAGYYTYQLVVSNSNQCSSTISDPFRVYVMPALSATIAASSGTICSNGASTATLTANPGNTNFSYLYQWALNGTDISGATNASYTTTANTTGSNTYSVRVAYALSTGITATATQVINAIAVPTKPAISVGQ